MEILIRKLGLDYVIVDSDYVLKASNLANLMVLNPSFDDQYCNAVPVAFTLNAHGQRFLCSSNDFKPAVGLNDYDGAAIDVKDLASTVRTALGVDQLGSGLEKRLQKIEAFFSKEQCEPADYKEPFFKYMYDLGVEAAAKLKQEESC